MLDLVGHPGDRFSRESAHIVQYQSSVYLIFLLYMSLQKAQDVALPDDDEEL